MGGKNPMVILNKPDIEIAVAASLDGSFAATGHCCMASVPLVVETGRYDAFVERLVAGTREQLRMDASRVDQRGRPIPPSRSSQRGYNIWTAGGGEVFERLSKLRYADIFLRIARAVPLPLPVLAQLLDCARQRG